MKNLLRLRLRKYSQQEIEQLVNKALEWILSALSVIKPVKIILIGSALGEQFDDWSDLDFVIVFKTKEDARAGRKALYGHRRPMPDRSIECLCVDEATFNEKSKIGGIYFIAAEQGKILYEK